MNIIKLDAIGSTNVYLKDLLSHQNLPNFSVVIAENQTAGKGQRGAKWSSEVGSNLTFSVLMKNLLLDITSIYDLNVLVALGVLKAVKKEGIDSSRIKWPNDILAGNKKIGGILIENIIKSDGEILSIVGIGLNVNQKDFSEFPQASSLAVQLGKDLDKEALFYKILENLYFYFNALRNGGKREIWKEYHAHLYKINTPMAFELPNGYRFMGIIQEVNQEGALLVKLENESVAKFYMKEVKMLY